VPKHTKWAILNKADPSDLTISLPGLLEGGSDDAFRQLVQDMLSMSARLQAIRDMFGSIAGITGPQYSMLIAIAHMQKRGIPVTVGGLGEHLHVSGTFITAESKKLEQAALLAKNANPADRRSIVLTLTDRGSALIDSVRATVRAGNDEIFRGVSADDFRVLRRVMAGLVPALDDALALTETQRRKRQID
jgi:DNA-binding MarR family transcriptional regulator